MTYQVTRDQVVREALEHMGIGENPPRSNRNMITEAYGLVGAWCAMFVWYVYRELGVDLRRDFTPGWAWTPSIVQAAKAKGMWVNGAAGMLPGDIALMKLPGGDPQFVNHVGIALGGGRYAEGNTSDVSAVRTRPDYQIVGYVRMPLLNGAGPKPFPPFPGREHFRLNVADAAVVALDKQLIRLKFTRHHDGNGYQAGPVYTSYTRENVAEFQRAQGWTGADADGFPGPETWRRLHTL